METKKINDAGILIKTVTNNVTTLDITTNAGCYRGGNVYSVKKEGKIIYGSGILRTYEKNRDNITEFQSGDVFTIQENIPNLFFFKEKTRMIEHYPSYGTKQKCPRYQDVKHNTIK